jgi:predicted metal-dependent peptidase
MNKLQQAKMTLCLHYPFFSYIALTLKEQVDKDVAYMSTNGSVLKYNPQYVEDTTVTELVWDICHETMHIACGHHVRLAKLKKKLGPLFDMEKAQIACDLAINHLIKDVKGRPDWVWMADKCDPPLPEGKDMETYYDLLTSESQQDDPEDGQNDDSQGEKGDETGNGSGGGGKGAKNDEMDGSSDGSSEGSGSGSTKQAQDDAEGSGSGEGNNGSGTGSGDGQTAEGDASGDTFKEPENARGFVEPMEGDEEDQQAEETKVRQTVASAGVSAKDAGKLPGHLQELIDSIGKPSVPWELVLRSRASKVTRNRVSYKRPNRRTSHRKDMVLPGRHNREVGKLIFALDTSASVPREELEKAIGEVNLIAETQGCEIRVIQFDTKIQFDQVYHKHELPLKMEHFSFVGRGGTDFQPVCDEVLKARDNRLFICFTDGYPIRWPSQVPVDTIWLMTTHITAPWGMTININN